VGTLDQYVEHNGIDRLDVVEMDVEGAEFLGLRGATKTISRLRPRLIIVELDEEYSRALGGSTAEAKTLLVDRGYALYRLNGANRAATVDPHEPEEWANVAAVGAACPDLRATVEELARGRRPAPTSDDA
jgi:hypothetical protein